MSDQEYKELPKAHTTYANVIKSLLPIGDGAKVSKEQLPTSTYSVSQLKIDRENLNDYRKICGFIDTIHVPVTYFAVLSQSLQMNMMAKESFPFVMLGLVHVENSVTQFRPITQDEVVSLSVKLDNLRDHDKGQQFDFITEVKVEEELVWMGVTTYLSRAKVKKPKSGEKKQRREPAPKLSTDDSIIDTTFSVPEDIGRRYAFVSGDFNLIHLHPLSARAFGFPKAIAHGMWSKAKCLAKIKSLPDAYTASVSFKMPILLPAEVELVVNSVSHQNTDGDSDNNNDTSHDKDITDRDNTAVDSNQKADINYNEIMQIGLYSSKNGKPHLIGSVCKV